MIRGLDELIGILEVPKSIVGFSGWRSVPQKYEGSSVLEIEAILQEGVSFRARCKPDLPDESVALMLFTETRQKPQAFARIDWRGTHHVNRNFRLGGDLFGHDAGRSHFHDIRLHRHIDYDELFHTAYSGNLPIARRLDQEPKDFSHLLQDSAILLGIVNLTDLPHPPWNRENKLL